MIQETLKPSYYELLQLQPYANPAVITAAYRVLSKLYHPDTAKEQADVETFRSLQQAYEILSDPKKRREYDSELRLNRPGWTTVDPYEKVEPSGRDPRWESNVPAESTQSAEDLEFYNSLYDNQNTSKRMRALGLLGLYIILMIASIVFFILAVYTLFIEQITDVELGMLYLGLGFLFLLVAKLESYYSFR